MPTRYKITYYDTNGRKCSVWKEADSGNAVLYWFKHWTYGKDKKVIGITRDGEN